MASVFLHFARWIMPGMSCYVADTADPQADVPIVHVRTVSHQRVTSLRTHVRSQTFQPECAPQADILDKVFISYCPIYYYEINS